MVRAGRWTSVKDCLVSSKHPVIRGQMAYLFEETNDFLSDFRVRLPALEREAVFERGWKRKEPRMFKHEIEYDVELATLEGGDKAAERKRQSVHSRYALGR